MKFMVRIALVGVLLLGAITAYQFSNISDARKVGRASTCAAFQKQIDIFVKLIKDGEKTLPTLEYYKTHPADLATAIKGDEHAIVVIKSGLPTYCA